MPGGLPIEQRGPDVLISVRVQPKASRNAVRIDAGGVLRVTLTAPPVEGAANEALVAYLAGVLGLPKRLIVLQSGEKSRTKTLRLAGATLAEVESRLRAAAV